MGKQSMERALGTTREERINNAAMRKEPETFKYCGLGGKCDDPTRKCNVCPKAMGVEGRFKHKLILEQRTYAT
jgi:hypothetical protein